MRTGPLAQMTRFQVCGSTMRLARAIRSLTAQLSKGLSTALSHAIRPEIVGGAARRGVCTGKLPRQAQRRALTVRRSWRRELVMRVRAPFARDQRWREQRATQILCCRSREAGMEPDDTFALSSIYLSGLRPWACTRAFCCTPRPRQLDPASSTHSTCWFSACLAFAPGLNSRLTAARGGAVDAQRSGADRKQRRAHLVRRVGVNCRKSSDRSPVCVLAKSANWRCLTSRSGA
jgi:hypothetical protein